MPLRYGTKNAPRKDFVNLVVSIVGELDHARPRETDLSAIHRSISPSRGLIRAVIGLIVTLVIGSGLAIWQLRLDAIADTEGDIHSLGTVVAEQITRTLQADDLVLYDI